MTNPAIVQAIQHIQIAFDAAPEGSIIEEHLRDALELLRGPKVEPDASKGETRTLGEKPFGTSHWAGVWNGYPALSLSYYGGASLFYFDGEWRKKKFEDLRELHDAIGVDVWSNHANRD